MSWRLRILDDAVKDIEDVLAATLREFGESQYETYKSLIRQALELIATDPRGPRVRARPEIHEQARTLHLARIGSPARHFFLLRIADDDIVEIARLLHDRMEVSRHLPESFKR